VPDQDPYHILESLRQYLDAGGFGDVEVELLDADWAYRTDPSDPLVGAVVAAGARAYDQPVVVVPTMAGSGPGHALCGELGIPSAGAGTGYHDSRVHAPNENIRIADYIQGIKHIAALLEEYAGTG
jgi:acetylornithine deacetylase/succinyl-diaminopimelate desuccinylase-like protein